MKIISVAVVSAALVAAQLLAPPAAWAYSAHYNPSPASSANKHATTGDCGPGNVVMGGGGYLEGTAGQVALTNLALTPDLQRFVVTAMEDGTGFAGTWRVWSMTMCTPPPPGYQVLASLSPAGSPDARTVTLACPAGKRVISVGGGVVDGKGQVLLDDLRIAADLRTVTLDAFEDDNGYAGTWRLGARVICAAPLPSLQRVSATSAWSSSTRRTATVACPVGTVLYGWGGEINSGNGEVRLEGAYRNLLDARATFTAAEDENGYSRPWSVTVYGVCADWDR